MSVVFGIAVICFVVWFGLCAAKNPGPSGRNRSLDDNRFHGHWRVVYPDGKCSQPFFRDVAEDYQKMFGGKIKPINRKAHDAK